MSLESLLAPFKWADEQVLRQYTKLTLKWEEKGHSRYSLALMAGSGLFLNYGLVDNPWRELYNIDSTPSTGDIALRTFFLLYSVAGGYDLVDSAVEMFSEKQIRAREISDAIALPRRDFGERQLHRLFRLPGLAFAGECVYEFMTRISHHDINLGDSLMYLGLTLFFVGPASSFYIKDADPKILGRAPAWKRAYDSARETIGKLKERLTPETQPVPAPIQGYSSTP
ncbi:MAG: hypothetical protein Q7R76_05915 [Candidatus Woesearchaeota archaeon]|nr:hypothetical protein [Candidatus Woesearchaeota archaeon]